MRMQGRGISRASNFKKSSRLERDVPPGRTNCGDQDPFFDFADIAPDEVIAATGPDRRRVISTRELLICEQAGIGEKHAGLRREPSLAPLAADELPI